MPRLANGLLIVVLWIILTAAIWQYGKVYDFPEWAVLLFIAIQMLGATLIGHLSHSKKVK